jgi:hypothetical protein
MSYDEMVEIVAKQLFVLVADYLPHEWDIEPERRRDYYRDKARELIRELAEAQVWVAPARRLRGPFTGHNATSAPGRG